MAIQHCESLSLQEKITKKYTCKTIPELILYNHSSACHLKKKKSHNQSVMQGLYNDSIS